MQTLTSSDRERQEDRWEKEGGLNLSLGYPILSPVAWELGSSRLHQWERTDCYTQVLSGLLRA